MTTVAILLAAGHSRRFGAEDKLLAEYHGRPLVTHAAEALRAAATGPLIAVTRSHEVAKALQGFEIVTLEGADNTQSDSLKTGIAAASRLGASRALVALGDMPHVSPGLLLAVAGTAPSAATDGEVTLPPVCFPASWFPRIMDLHGDKGAAALLKGADEVTRVRAQPSELRDIDLPSDL